MVSAYERLQTEETQKTEEAGAAQCPARKASNPEAAMAEDKSQSLSPEAVLPEEQ